MPHTTAHPTHDNARDDTLAQLVDHVIRSRRTVRSFQPTPVAKSLVADILDVARAAPSNSNTQPWSVHVLTGEPKHRLSQALLQSHARDSLPPAQHFPGDMPTACKRRQGDFASRYYTSLGIDRDDAIRSDRQSARNYLFFDAPVGLIFTIDARLTKHSWADYGLFLQTLMLAARARGLDTCAQVSFVRHAPVIAEVLALPPGQEVVCGMSLGYAASSSGPEACRMPRESVEAFSVFLGFDAPVQPG